MAHPATGRVRWRRATRLAVAAGCAGSLLPPAASAASEKDRAAAVELVVSAAASLKDVVEEAASKYRGAHPGVTPTLNTAASGVLLVQIEKGAPVDLLVTASPLEIDRLARAGRVEPGSRRSLASNTLVLAVPAGAKPPRSLEELRAARFERIAIGNPKTVPAGRYASECLRSLKLWEALEPRLVFAENVRQVLDYVARKEVDAGFVYRTDLALVHGRVSEALRAPDGSHAPIVYEGVVIRDARQAAAAHAFLAFLGSPEGQKVFARHGFRTVPSPSPLRD